MATGKSQRGVRAALERLSFHIDQFVTIQTADKAPSKPHPAMINQAMADTGIPQERTIMIGDTSFDMEMALNAGVRPIGVTWGYHSPQELMDAGAEAIVSTFENLLSIISSMTEMGGEK
jgi:phosphoglycolate phosphatase